MITKLDFVAVPTRNPDQARDFYIGMLGLRADDNAQYEFWAGDTCFALWEPERLGQTFVAQKNGHIALHVDDLPAARAELEGKGIEFVGETFDTGVCHMAFFRDPDGNDLMLHSRYAPRT
jgi:catechol 2,3-dioxygenase-like lactoylglutathione lyase family enzyme